MCEANTVSIDKEMLHETELVMHAADSLGQESALYKSILLPDIAKCQMIMHFSILNGTLGDIHPIILSRAAALLQRSEHEGMPAPGIRRVL